MAIQIHAFAIPPSPTNNLPGLTWDLQKAFPRRTTLPNS